MKLSMKIEYACQVLAQLGHQFGKEQMSHIDDLAEAENVPQNYLVQILNDLRNAGLIISRRGKQGGYALAKSPEAITLLDIVNALEGKILTLSGNQSGDSAKATQVVWGQVAAHLAREAASHSVRDLMDKEGGAMWYI